VKITNHRGDDLYLAPSNFTPPEPPELPEPASIFPIDQLADTIKATVDPESWNAEGAGIDVKNNLLLVRNTTENLDQVQRLIEELRTNSGPLVNLEVRFITVEDNFLRDVGVDIRGLGDNSQGTGVPGLGTPAPHDDVFFGGTTGPTEPSSVGFDNSSGIYYNDGQDGAYAGRVENIFDALLGNEEVLLGTGGLSFQHTFLDDTQLEVILRAVEKSERSERVTATKITVFNTQRAVVQVLTQVAYVGDYDVEIAQASNIANPQIRYVKEGTVLDVKPVVSADRRFITLEMRPTVATLVRPIPTFSTPLSSGPGGVSPNAPVIIQVPKLEKNSVRTTVTMPDGGTLLLGGLKFYDEVDATSEVPLIGKIPILSFLFSRKGRYVNRRNLVALISAQIVALEEIEPRGEYTPPAIPSLRHAPVRPLPECPTPCPVPCPRCPSGSPCRCR
jgi:general secretion pathway protein D